MKFFIALLVLVRLGEARRPFYSEEEEIKLEKRQTSDTATFAEHNFDQLVDHFPNSPKYEPHTTKTFKQRYYFDASYYQPGGPIFLYIGGETSGPSRFVNMQTGIIKILMEATNGLGIILENRFYGRSYPYNLSTTDNLRWLTTEQTIADNAYFAQHATFPGVSSNKSINAPHSPWILYGGSLAGAQTAFSLKEYGGDGGVLWAGISASGTTYAQLAYPQWYAPIEKYAPQDCISSINAIVKNIDTVFDSGNQTLIHQMKAIFGLESLGDADFAQTIAFPIGGPFYYPTCTWQELNWDPAQSCPDFWSFCGNVSNVFPTKNEMATDYLLSEATGGKPWVNLGNYANYIKKYVLPICSTGDYNHTPLDNNAIYCFGTQNETYWADIRNSAKRSYLYSTCTEGGLYQVAPKSGPSLIANPLQVGYTQQWCTWAFPPGKYNSIPSTPNLELTNKYGGYAVVQDRLARIDGDQDVWGDVCYHSNDAPLRYSISPTEEDAHPQLLITGGGHHWDSYGLGSYQNVSLEPQFIMQAHLWEIRTVQKWLIDWNARK